VRRRALAVVLMSTLLLAGCSAIPTTGPVQAGPTQVPDEPAIVFLPNPPAAGAKPADIVNGFLQAGAGSDFSVAREYLTKSFSAQWRPRAGVLVHDKPLKVVETSDRSIRVDVQTVARVQADGSYTASPSEQTLPFRLEQVGGQWRIAEAPDGIVLAQTVFERTYQPRTVDFFDPTFRRLVPDVRWFATRSKPTTSVVRALLDGPAGPISGGVTVSAFPADAKLESAVTASDGSTTVVVSIPGKDPDRRTTDRMQQQLLRSLQLQTGAALHLIVNGRVAPTASVLQVQGSVQAPVVYAGGRFGTAQSTGAVSEDSVLGKRVAALRPRAVTVSAGQRLAAVLTHDADVAIVTASGSRVVDTRARLAAPTLDQRGWAYSVPKDDPTGLIAFATASRRSVRLASTTLGGEKVVAIEASPDGTRLLVLVQRTNGDWQSYVAGIVRDADGAPSALTTDIYPIAVPAGVPIDATWVDESTVAILTAAPDGSDTVTAQQLGGLASSAGRLSNAESIVGTSSKTDLRARDNTGNVLEPSPSVAVWQNVFPTTVNVSVLAVQR
jgi:hypothetical protein